MKCKAAFFHDHVFEKYGESYYSPGKLPYVKLSEYLDYFSSLTVFSRFRDVTSLSKSAQTSNGPDVEFVPLPNLSKLTNVILRRKVRNQIFYEYKNRDINFFIIRLPSEIGLIALKLAVEYKIPH